MITEKQLGPITILTFSDKVELTNTFARVSEYYEGVGYKGRLDISHEAILDTYADLWGGSYDVAGFNVPASAIREFFWPANKTFLGIPTLPVRSTVRADAIPEELALAAKYPKGRYYIGVLEGDTITLDHEISHALYATDRVYRINCHVALINNGDGEALRPLYQLLCDHGYHPDVWRDEIVAWIVEDDLEGHLGIEARRALRPLRNVLTAHFINALARVGGM